MMAGPQLALVHDEGGPAHPDEIQGTSSWLSELVPRRAAAGMDVNRTQGTTLRVRTAMGGGSGRGWEE